MAMSMPFTSAMSKVWCAKVGKQIKRKPLGTGPYVITDWKAGQSISAEKNTNWTGDTGQWVDSMEFGFTANPSTALLKLERGEVDVLGDSIPSADYVRTKNDPDVEQVHRQRAADRLVLHVHERAREAVRQREGAPGGQLRDRHRQDPEAARRAGAGAQPDLSDGLPGYQADTTFYTYDPAKAKQLLADAGFPNGFKTTFVTHNVDPFPKLAQAIQADLKAVGIDAEIKQMDRATYWDYISLKKSHAAIGLSDWYQDFPDPSDWIGPMFTQPIDGGANSSFYESPEVNKLYADSASELDPTKRIDMFVQMQQIIMTDAPTAPLYQPKVNSMHTEDVGNFFLHPVWIFDYPAYYFTTPQQ